MNCKPLSTPNPLRAYINVVIIGRITYPKGMAGTKRVQHFIDYMKSQHINVSLLLLSRSNNGITKRESTGWYRGTSYRRIGNDLKLDLSMIWRFPQYVWNGFKCLVQWQKKDYKNILFCYGGPDFENIWFILSAKMLGYKIVFDIVEDYAVVDHQISKFTAIKIRSLLYFEKKLHFLADGLIVISKHLYDKFSVYVRHKKAIKLIPISAKAEVFNHKKKFNTPVRIVYSGSFGWKDGVDDLVEAFQSLQKQENNITLFLTGLGAEENICRIKRKISGNEGIKYLGYLEDDEFYKFLREADILCMTRINSHFANAGFPFKLGEYLATGNPVIASASSDVSYYLEDMKDAVLIKPGDIGEIEGSIKFLLKEQDVAIQIGQSGREKCCLYFDPLKNGKLLMDLLESI